MVKSNGLAAALFAFGFIFATPARAGPTDEVRRGFDQFVAAQNAHDLGAVGVLLAGGPEFIWVTRGTIVKGRAAALNRFGELFRGTWHLQVTSPAETFLIDRNTVQLVAPVTFRIGPPGSVPTETRFILTQLWHRQQKRWQVASILPIPVPAN